MCTKKGEKNSYQGNTMLFLLEELTSLEVASEKKQTFITKF